jgi:NAD(P)-dependent dehydrogenase (short-subunit alcohol dehydrogenase family)
LEIKEMSNMFDLTGKKAYVTGGAGGIGRAVSLGLAERGADVAIVDLAVDKARQVAEEVKAKGVDSFAIECDVTKEDQVQGMIKAIVGRWGRIDIAHNNAGICINEDAENMSYAQWKKVIDVNLSSIFLTCKEVGKVMIAQGKGSIINTASMSGHIVNFPQPQCSYNASKAGVILLTKSLAVEWVNKGVRVNCISPGYIGTAITQRACDAWKESWKQQIPIHRLGTPEELVSAIIYLASDESSYTTGCDVVVDGAFTCI